MAEVAKKDTKKAAVSKTAKPKAKRRTDEERALQLIADAAAIREKALEKDRKSLVGLKEQLAKAQEAVSKAQLKATELAEQIDKIERLQARAIPNADAE